MNDRAAPSRRRTLPAKKRSLAMIEPPARKGLTHQPNPAAKFPFHFYLSTWDDRDLERQVDQLVADGFPIPRWGWPVLGYYNGVSGRDRILGWQKAQVAKRSGLLGWPQMCSICGNRNNLQMHNENYYRPLNGRPICKSCHYVLHRRFKAPTAWLNLSARYAFAGAWHTNISMAELTEQQSRWLATKRNPMDARQLTKPTRRASTLGLPTC